MLILTFCIVHAKFRRDRLNGCGNIANFRFPSNMAAVRHLESVVRMRGSSQDVLLGVFITVQNLVEISSVVLIISKFNDVCDLAGNCLFTRILERFSGI